MSEPSTAKKNSPKVCFLCLIAGRVQGVFFRAATREQALHHGITGHAHNLPDGRVEVLACGDVEAVARLREWLRIGPAQAQVSGLTCEPVDYRTIDGFSIR